jgi:hypothetical protein
MVKILFNEQELFDLFKKNGLTLIETVSFEQNKISKINEPIFYKDYLCEKK